MGKVSIEVSDKILQKLPPDKEKLEEVLKLGLKQLDLRSKKKNKRKSVVGETYGALPIKNHGLIEKVREQLKYGE